jgi:hypothetical protein
VDVPVIDIDGTHVKAPRLVRNDLEKRKGIAS